MKTTIKTFCWQCGGKLNRAPDGAGFLCVVWKDELGNEHDVHKICGENLERGRDPTWGIGRSEERYPPNREPDHTRAVDGKMEFKE